MTVAYAPGKIILSGEHAVVYGRPAVALPVTQVRAQATMEDAREGQGLVIEAADLGQTIIGREEQASSSPHPLAMSVFAALGYLGLSAEQDLTITVRSDIPIAGGLGSGAAVSTALVRAVAQHFSRPLPAQEVSRLVYQVERLHHGTPSGIDNTVIAYEQPVYFVRDQTLETFPVGRTLTLLIADTGEPSSTKEVVGAVRQAWQRSKHAYESLFDKMGEIATLVRRAIEEGDLVQVGGLMDKNHQLLQALEVSSHRLDSLVQAAKDHGALGAKLSGAGRGGNMIALVTPDTRREVERALLHAGAERVIENEVKAAAENDAAAVSPAAPARPDEGLP
ncbi:MAG: mevalonate kinase [Anaerolineae bacterium]|nr:mevalonate kinase [Anaerolineae bacterium]